MQVSGGSEFEVMCGPQRTVVLAKIVCAIITGIQVPSQDPKDNKKGAPPRAATIAEQPLAESATKMPASAEHVYNPEANDANCPRESKALH